MTKRLALAICTVTAALAATLSAPVATALIDGSGTRPAAAERTADTSGAATVIMAGRAEGPSPTDTSWGG